jgi:hypothetical protein
MRKKIPGRLAAVGARVSDPLRPAVGQIAQTRADGSRFFFPAHLHFSALRAAQTASSRVNSRPTAAKRRRKRASARICARSPPMPTGKRGRAKPEARGAGRGASQRKRGVGGASDKGKRSPRNFCTPPPLCGGSFPHTASHASKKAEATFATCPSSLST